MKYIYAILGALLITCIYDSCGIDFASNQTYYVSVNGSDSNSGKTPEQALQSIQAGVNKLRAGDSLLIRGGTYRETVSISCSGEHDKPIVIQAFKDEQVVISGCDPVSDWKKHEGNIWKAPMPWTMGKGRNQVFYNGQAMIEARFPNEADPGLEMPVSGLSKLWPTFGLFLNPEPGERPERVVSKLLNNQPDNYWKGAIYYGVHYGGWSAQTGVIESSKAGEIIVKDRTGQWWSNATSAPENGRGMIIGHMNALDQPGEWHWQEDTLYILTPDNQNPNGLIEAKSRNLAIDLSQSKHIHIDKINVTGASMRMENAAYCVFNHCDLRYVSHFTRLYAVNRIEPGEDNVKTGETGIYVGGHHNSFLNCSVQYSAGAGLQIRGHHHTIHNCLINEICYTSHYFTAICDAIGDWPEYENFLIGGHTVTFNTMCNSGRHLFNIPFGGSKQSRDRGPIDNAATLFAHNHLYNGMLQTRDAGLLTCYYGSGGTLNDQNFIFAYNVLHDTYDLFGMKLNNLGIVYLDAGTCDVDLYNNLLWAEPNSHQRDFWYNTCCVDIRDWDNVFRKSFTRTSAQLKPADFPNNKPFRFGHDFQNPPPLPVWPKIEKQRIEAETSKSMSESMRKNEDALTNMKDNDWFAIENVNMDENWQSIVIRFASDNQKMNTDHTGRTKPRHIRETDPLVLEAPVNDSISHTQIKRRWTYVYNTPNGSWLRFNDVPLGKGYKHFRVIYGVDNPNYRYLDIRLDSLNGMLAGRVGLKMTYEYVDTTRPPHIQTYDEAICEINPEATGTRDVFIVFRSDDGKPVGAFEYFRFENYRGQIPLQNDEVKMEIRVGNQNGEKIGEIYPRFTGGNDTFRQMVATLGPSGKNGLQSLYFVIRSATEKPIGTIDWISLEKGRKPLNLKNIGIEPYKRNGRFVYPEPTHLPL